MWLIRSLKFGTLFKSKMDFSRSTSTSFRKSRLKLVDSLPVWKLRIGSGSISQNILKKREFCWTRWKWNITPDCVVYQDCVWMGEVLEFYVLPVVIVVLFSFWGDVKCRTINRTSFKWIVQKSCVKCYCRENLCSFVRPIWSGCFSNHLC